MNAHEHTSGPSADRQGSDRAALAKAAGAVGWLGAWGVLVADLVAILLVERHDPIAETISKLAVGPHAWIQDLGLNVFGIGIALCAAGLILWRAGGLAWRAGILLLALLGLDVVVIAEYNQYAGELGEDATVHRALVYVLYVLFAGTSLLLAHGLGRAGRRWKTGSLLAGALWIVLAPVLLVVPTSIDGAYERLVGLVLLGWVAAISILLITRPREPDAPASDGSRAPSRRG